MQLLAPDQLIGRMPLYFFHIRDRDLLIPDDEGVVLADQEEALQEARAGARDMIRDALLTGDTVEHQLIEVTDDVGKIVGLVEVRSLTQRPH